MFRWITAALGLASVLIPPALIAQQRTPAAGIHPLRIVVGFMGGRVRADNMIHQEATVAKELRDRRIPDLHVLVFANHDDQACKAVLKLVDQNGDHSISEAERNAVEIAIYGHSWGASETLHLARALQKERVPVILTVQVDSVQKPGENDREVPSNVAQAVNLYQTDGLLRGRDSIYAQNPADTRILANQQYHYDAAHQVDISRFPWFARTFMRQHIMIENDPEVWTRVEDVLLKAVQGDRNIVWARASLPQHSHLPARMPE